jgi:MFS transporter, putative metabolite:H+ symporter
MAAVRETVLADGATADVIARLERIPVTTWHIRARLVIGSATFFDAFDALSIAFVAPILKDLWSLGSTEVSYLFSVSYAGQLVGAFFFSWLAERVGRVRAAAAAIFLMSAMAIACAAADGYATMLACRFVQGIGIGGEMPVAAAYIGELSRAQGRGRFFLLYEMIFPIGLMATGQVAWWLVPLLGWQSMFLAGAVPGLVVALLVLRLRESPRWLASRGRHAEASAIVAEIEASAGMAATDAPTRPLSASPSATGGAARSRWAELVSPAYRRRTLIVGALWAITFFIANGLNLWMASFYRSVYHLGLQDSLLAASLTNVAQVLALLACVVTIDRIGRRRWAVASFILGGSLLALLGLIGAGSVASVIILATLAYGIIGSTNAVLYLYTPEIYPTRMRALGTGLGTSWLRLASMAGPVAVGAVMSARGIAAVFLMFAAVSVAGALAASQMIETRGRRLEEIAT